MNAYPEAPPCCEFDDYLDYEYEKMTIGYLEFRPSSVLKELDSYAYDCMYEEWSEEHTTWRCENCGEEFDNEDDAEACCREEEEPEPDCTPIQGSLLDP